MFSYPQDHLALDLTLLLLMGTLEAPRVYLGELADCENCTCWEPLSSLVPNVALGDTGLKCSSRCLQASPYSVIKY